MSQKSLAIDEAKKYVKTLHNYTCEKCGNKGRQQHGAHIMPVTWAGTAADTDNILDLCSTCHSVGRESAHEDGVQFARWLEEKFPGRYDRLREKAVKYATNPFPKIDWKEVRKEIKKKMEELDE